ncbi:hypothetical protein AG1IA_02999 [Rhizoctonia solani AG-1 IA]|uniref:Uncharacterized protein n=1 Tax=Thanatephorus cucumeris (strain AG1-IA) TaxID=983506 RepID=L8WY84_THACA|nr:hypothetical protein AG1IA_02999 [Rhizoctonia solani AG-1 IA]
MTGLHLWDTHRPDPTRAHIHVTHACAARGWAGHGTQTLNIQVPELDDEPGDENGNGAIHWSDVCASTRLHARRRGRCSSTPGFRKVWPENLTCPSGSGRCGDGKSRPSSRGRASRLDELVFLAYPGSSSLFEAWRQQDKQNGDLSRGVTKQDLRRGPSLVIHMDIFPRVCVLLFCLVNVYFPVVITLSLQVGAAYRLRRGTDGRSRRFVRRGRSVLIVYPHPLLSLSPKPGQRQKKLGKWHNE